MGSSVADEVKPPGAAGSEVFPAGEGTGLILVTSPGEVVVVCCDEVETFPFVELTVDVPATEEPGRATFNCAPKACSVC